MDTAQRPPGYRDSGKADATGDYLIFRQLMNEAKECKLPVVFITDDEKTDWYRREHDIPLGPRYELREEMIAEAGVPFVIMTTERFLLHAEKYLNADVSAETVDQAKELPGIVEDDIRTEWERRLRTVRLERLERLEEDLRDLHQRNLEELRVLAQDPSLVPVENRTALARSLEQADLYRRLLKYRELMLMQAPDVQSSPDEDEQG